MKCHQGQVVSENHGHDNENINTINDYHTGYDNIAFGKVKDLINQTYILSKKY